MHPSQIGSQLPSELPAFLLLAKLWSFQVECGPCSAVQNGRLYIFVVSCDLFCSSSVCLKGTVQAVSIKADILAKAIKEFLAASGLEDKALEPKSQAWSSWPLIVSTWVLLLLSLSSIIRIAVPENLCDLRNIKRRFLLMAKPLCPQGMVLRSDLKFTSMKSNAHIEKR